MSLRLRMSNDYRSLTFAALIAGLTVLSAPAQTTISTGSIQGTVTDQSGAVLAGASVIVTNRGTGQTTSVTTTSSGTYSSGALVPGDYKVRIAAKGFKTVEGQITVQVGVTSSGNFKLDVGDEAQVVEVRASGVQVNTEQATVQGVLTATQIENLPINGRNFLDLAQLEPGVQIQDGGTFDPTKDGFSSISFGGRFGRTARIEVDGVDISDETVGTTTQNIPQGAIQEFQTGQSLLDLSTELTSSGSVNVVTKSGTNNLHGEGFYFFRDQSVDANLPGASDNPFQRNQFGGNLGGPIIKDKVFFFIDGERNKQDLLNPVINSSPFQALSGSFNSPFRETEALGKLDWNIGNGYKMFYRFSFDQNKSVLPTVANSFQPFANASYAPVHAVGLDFNTGNYTYSIRFEYMKFRNGIKDAVTGTTIFNPFPGIELAIGEDPTCLTAGVDQLCTGPNVLAPQQTIQSNHQIKYDGSRVYKSHIFRYGASLNHLQGGGFASFFGLAPAVGSSPADCTGSVGGAIGCVPSDPATYPVMDVLMGNGQGFPSEKPAFGFPAGGLGPDNRLAWYVGDAWKVKPNLTVNYGVRYVRDSGRTDSDLAAIPELDQFGPGLGNRVRQPNSNFAPQLGITWDPHASGKTAIRAGIGLYYENSLWNNNLFDRPGRLQQGLFFGVQGGCSGGSAPPGGIVTLPGGQTQDWSTICGQPVGSVAGQIAAFQQQYQAAVLAAGPATNEAFIGSTLTDSQNGTGTNLLAPNYRTPRSVQMNLGIQHEMGRGLVLTIDYLRNVATHNLLSVDTNHVGAARTLDAAAATTAIANTNSQFTDPSTNASCGTLALSAGINCAIAGGATIADYAANGLDSGDNVCFGFPCPGLAAFPGENKNLGSNQMLFPIGRSVYNALQFSLRQDVHNPFRGIGSMNLQVSYALSRYVATAQDSDFVNYASDNDQPLRFIGPNGLDRRHQFSFGSVMDVPKNFRVSFIGHFYSPLPLTLQLNPPGVGGIFVTDWTGDGTGDGSLVSSNSAGDILPGTNIGSFGRSVTASNINTKISAFNTSFAGQATPAGQALINAGLFNLSQLTSLGGVMQPITPAPSNQTNMGWLKDFDLTLSWAHKFAERVEVRPGVSFFNLFNYANFDGPNNPLSGFLNSPGAANTTAGSQPNDKRLGLGSGVFSVGAPRVAEFTLKLTF
jgi:hypothetical protein